MQTELTRRRLLALGGGTAVTVTLAGCFEPREGDEDEDDEEEGGFDGDDEEDDDRLAEPAPGVARDDFGG